MKRRTALSLLTVVPASLAAGNILAADRYQPNLKQFTSLFDGKSLKGWTRLASAMGGEDGKWEVIDGVIAGDQYPEGKGGLLVTEKEYANYEVYAEVKADYPIDSGLFLRVQPNVLSYQITIDYRPEGEVGAIYSPGGGNFLVHYPEGEKIWKKGEYNTVIARIEGQPPKIKAWINGVQVQDYTDTLFKEKERVPATGVFGIQVHPGESWGKGNKVWFRKIMIKEL
ncbi:MAG: 3-keto-disaccharide hydrolase [Candidatus Latescibacterota bacterium]